MTGAEHLLWPSREEPEWRAQQLPDSLKGFDGSFFQLQGGSRAWKYWKLRVYHKILIFREKIPHLSQLSDWISSLSSDFWLLPQTRLHGLRRPLREPEPTANPRPALSAWRFSAAPAARRPQGRLGDSRWESDWSPTSFGRPGRSMESNLRSFSRISVVEPLRKPISLRLLPWQPCEPPSWRPCLVLRGLRGLRELKRLLQRISQALLALFPQVFEQISLLFQPLQGLPATSWALRSVLWAARSVRAVCAPKPCADRILPEISVFFEPKSVYYLHRIRRPDSSERWIMIRTYWIAGDFRMNLKIRWERRCQLVHWHRVIYPGKSYFIRNLEIFEIFRAIERL